MGFSVVALITCPDCATEVSDHAAACPKCARPIGASVSTGTKVALSGVRITGCLVFILAGCLGVAGLLGGGLGMMIVAVALAFVGIVMAMVTKVS